MKSPLPEAISGSIFTEFYNYHKHDKNCKISLLGAGEGIALQAMKNINEKVGRNIVVRAHFPSFRFEKKPDECTQIIKLIMIVEQTFY